MRYKGGGGGERGGERGEGKGEGRKEEVQTGVRPLQGAGGQRGGEEEEEEVVVVKVVGASSYGDDMECSCRPWQRFISYQPSQADGSSARTCSSKTACHGFYQPKYHEEYQSRAHVHVFTQVLLWSTVT